DWTRYSFLYEIYRNTRPGAYRLLCNPLAKDRTYSYIYHMPCRFDCPATRRLAARLRAEIGRREPDFVRRIDQHLGLPYLVFRERKHYAFRGVLEGRTIRYSEVFYPDGAPEGRPYLERLARGDQVVLGEGAVDILRRGRRVDRIEGRSHGFAPEIPFMVAFR
ncbi:MAG TPA: hypothetical protein VNO81_03290, partial [Candidatus Nitrosotenuis sp.]|nr:hypothetical protein [Candidatus Nitrosotenuis sp.]